MNPEIDTPTVRIVRKPKPPLTVFEQQLANILRVL